MFGELHERVRAARVENRVRQIGRDFLHPVGRDARGAASPVVFRQRARAGDVKFEVRIFLFQFAEFVVENDVRRRADAVKHGDFRFQFPPRGLARKSAKRRHARTAGDTYEMFVRLIDRQKFSDRRDDEQFVARLRPIHDARAHLAVALDGDFVKAAIQRAGRERVGALVSRRVRPIDRDELAGLEIGIVAVGPFEADGFGVGQFHRRRFDGHFENFFGHKIFNARQTR